MSQQKPASNPILTFLLWGAVFFLGYTIFFGNKTKPDPRNSDEIYASILKLNADGNDTEIAKEVALYDGKQKAELESGRIKPQQYDENIYRVDIIKDATIYVNGVKNDNNGKLEAAYNDLRGKFEKFGNTPLWQQAVTVAPFQDKIVGGTVTSGQLYKLVTADLGASNKTAKVLGYFSGYELMDWLVHLTGANPYFSYWFAALLLAVLVRLAVFPLAQKQFIWGRRMAQLAPYVKEIQEKFKDKKTGKISDQQAMSLETMELYKRYGFNPMAGCLPLLVQLPLFLIIYRCMLLYKFEFTKGYFLWIHPGATSLFGLHLAPNLGERDFLMIVVYGVSMVVTTLLTPVSDPSNVRQQRMIGVSMAVLFAVMMFFYPLPSAFATYWIFTNIFATAQSLYVYRMPVAPLQPVQTAAGGVVPTTSKDLNGKASVDPGFFGKTGKASAKKKRKR